MGLSTNPLICELIDEVTKFNVSKIFFHSMQTITEDEVMAFWRYQMPTNVMTRVLKNIFKRSKKADIIRNSGSWINLEGSTLSNSNLDCLKAVLGEDFVILEYRSWIINSLRDPQNPDLEGGFLDFWLQNARTNNVRFENSKHVFNYADSRQIKNDRAKKYATEHHVHGATAGMDIIAAFSESKIWIGWSPDIDHPQLAGIVVSTKSVPAPCFSWHRNYPDNPPSNNCLAPWVKSRYWGKLQYIPENSPALFRELIVRCKGDDGLKFLKTSSEMLRVDLRELLGSQLIEEN